MGSGTAAISAASERLILQGLPTRRVRQFAYSMTQRPRKPASDAAGSHFFFRPGRRFQFAFADAIAVAFDDRHVGMMQQAIQQRDDAGGVGKDLVPFFERSVGGEDQRLALVAAIDDFIEQVGGFVVEGQIADFVDA